MNLSEYLAQEGRGTAAKLAEAIGAYSSDVSDWAGARRPVPIKFAVAIERATGGIVSRRDLRPDDWQAIWPELAAPTTEGA